MSGRHNENETHEFSNESFLQVLAQLVNEEKPMFDRTAAVYLSRSLNVKQSLDESHRHRLEFKINVTLGQLLEMRLLINECKANNYLDVAYVWCKAIHFVYYRNESIGASNTLSANYSIF